MGTRGQRIFQALMLVVLWGMSQALHSQVVINEYSCANVSIITNSFSDQDDYIELYNAGSSVVDIGSFYLSDKQNNPMKWQFPPSVILNPGQFLLVYASSRDTLVGGVYHTNFKLTQTRNERIVFSNSLGILVDQVLINRTQTNHSRMRYPNGSADWVLSTIPSPGASNAGPSEEYMPAPVFSLPAGAYSGSATVSLSGAPAGAKIHFTTDGSEPLISSTLYSSPLTFNQTTVLRAKIFNSNPAIPASFTETNTYFIDVNHPMPVLSVCGTQLNNLFSGNTTPRIGSLEYFDESMTLIDESTGEYNKHGNDSWAYAQRGVDFICRDEFGYNADIRHQIFPIKERDNYQRLILKAAANDNYPFASGAHVRDAYVHTLSQLADLKLDERTSRFCVVYMNGQYWGIYDLREKVDDHDFTEYYYDQPKEELQYLKTWGSTWPEYGGGLAVTNWGEIRAYIMNNDMTDPIHFAHVDSFYNWKSLIDYVVLNSYIVCSDWLNWNTGWWRGLNPDGDGRRWRYTLWDMDASFGHYINYTGIPNTSPTADPCNPEFLNNPGNQGHIPILNKLMSNEIFNQYYISRFIDLSNTYLSCSHMQEVLDSMIAVIEPEMPAHIQKWGGTMSGWHTEVLQLKDFIDARCAELAEGLIDCYDITGPFDLVLKIEPPGTGEIKLNSEWIENYPFSGVYFGDIDLLMEARGLNGYLFDHWEIQNNSFIQGTDPSNGKMNLISNDTIIAYFISPTPVIELGSDTSICYGNTLILDAGNPGSTYHWSNGSSERFLSVTESGTYQVTVTYLTFPATAQITVTVNYPPVVSLQDTFYLCKGNQLILLPDIENAESIIWNNYSTNPFLQVSQPGTYWIQVFNDCGNDRDTSLVLQGQAAKVELGPDRYLNLGETLTLNVEDEGANYLWNTESTESSILITSPGYYWVVVENDCGSSFDDLNVYFRSNLFIPNAFSPNGDGLNDDFGIDMSGLPPTQSLLYIYNRLGELIFESTYSNDRWDGRFHGKPVPEGSYIYLFKYYDFAGEQIIKGTVNLIR